MAVGCWGVPGLADGEVEEGEEAEYVCEGGVEPVVIRCIVISDVDEFCDCNNMKLRY